MSSDLVIVGKVLKSEAYLSTDKSGIYTEFTVNVEECLKAPNVDNLQIGKTLRVDRPGGYVRYPNGQLVSYKIQGTGLPKAGTSYLFFLKLEAESGNYAVLAAYEFSDQYFRSLDRGMPDELTPIRTVSDLLETVRTRIARDRPQP